jgi:hypothetical protein
MTLQVTLPHVPQEMLILKTTAFKSFNDQSKLNVGTGFFENSKKIILMLNKIFSKIKKCQFSD